MGANDAVFDRGPSRKGLIEYRESKYERVRIWTLYAQSESFIPLKAENRWLRLEAFNLIGKIPPATHLSRRSLGEGGLVRRKDCEVNQLCHGVAFGVDGWSKLFLG
jgi:hypothetical protein